MSDIKNMVCGKESNMSKKCVKPQIRFVGFDEDWERRKIREICKYYSSNLSVSDIDVDGKYQLYDVNGVIGKTNKLLQKEEYITIIKDGSGVGRVRKNLAYSSFIGTMGAIVPNDSEINYLFAEFQRKDFSKHINGATIPHIYFSNYGEDILCIPNVKEQQKIGVYFCNLDKLITLYQNKYDKLTDIKKSMLEKTFPKNGSNVPEIRFKGFSGDWEWRKWLDTVDISTEMVDPKTGEYDELPHVAPGNIESFTGQLYNNIKLVKDENLISGKFRFYDGDIIYGKINPQLGKYVFARFEGLTSADAYVLNAKNGIVQEYLYTILQTKDFFDYSVAVSKRSGIPKINRDELNAYSFLVPFEEEQKQLGNMFLTLDKLITLHQCKLEKLKNMKKACMEKMFV